MDRAAGWVHRKWECITAYYAETERVRSLWRHQDEKRRAMISSNANAIRNGIGSFIAIKRRDI